MKTKKSCAADEREATLTKWLTKMGATALAECNGPNGSALTWYSLRGHTIIVQRYMYGNGYEIYMPPSISNIAQDSFNAVERMIQEFEGRRSDAF